jgi:hypothetical protein
LAEVRASGLRPGVGGLGRDFRIGAVHVGLTSDRDSDFWTYGTWGLEKAVGGRRANLEQKHQKQKPILTENIC